ncbi:hypothetical protein SAMN06265222_11937 [Neorhodopirellula lusitana]|uniref:ATP-grasp domain-containing protein n=1 Tax=Neorhodopirellula lusitana TaxID=445327 RepID=A0ABY1QR25_9BACT|nr:hypothetical protein [Neorhodopirellula lusitana]SMP75439.1 hypothetical protein SAMN06265222_11937 [Neorhodopirellula lusitana]
MLFGAYRWQHDYIIQDAIDAGLRTVVVVPSSKANAIAELRPKRRWRQCGQWLRKLGRRDKLGHREKQGGTPGELIIETRFSSDKIRKRYGRDIWVLAMDDYCVAEAARLSQSSSSPCFPVAAADTVRCKQILREKWNELSRGTQLLKPVEYQLCQFDGFSAQTPCQTVTSELFHHSDIEQFVVKPDSLAGSIAILPSTRSQLPENVSTVLRTLGRDWQEFGKRNELPVDPVVLVEERIARSPRLHESAEFSAEFVSFAGQHQFIGFTQKWVSENFMETAHVHPPIHDELPSRLKDAACEAIKSLLESMDVRYGISHWEFIVTGDDRIALVEGHLRPPGDNINQLVGLATGTRLTDRLLAKISGKPVPLSAMQNRYAGIFWLAPSCPVWNVVSVESSKMPGCQLTIDDGDALYRYTSESPYLGPTGWGSRHLSVQVEASSSQQLIERLELFVAGARLVCKHDSTTHDVPLHAVFSHRESSVQ